MSIRSRLGFGAACIQQNEDAANMAGVNITLYKVIAYTLSALFCGTVGAAYASWTGYIDPTDCILHHRPSRCRSMCLLGGPGTVLGPVIGTAAFTLLEEVFWANFLDYNRAILGLVIVVLIFFLPGGLLAISYRGVGATARPRCLLVQRPPHDDPGGRAHQPELRRHSRHRRSELWPGTRARSSR